MSEKYKYLLNSLTIKDLKQIISSYMSHIDIRVQGMKKNVLIENIMKHTRHKDGEIILKEKSILKPELMEDIIKKRNKKHKEENSELMDEYGRLLGLKENVKEKYLDAKYYDAHMHSLGVTPTELKTGSDKDKKLIKKLKFEYDEIKDQQNQNVKMIRKHKSKK